MKFFYSPGSCALATHLTLAEAGADYEAIRLDFAAGEQQGVEYLAINPKGRVPALVTDRGILTETPAILLYLAQTHPHAELAPLNDPFALAQLQAFNSYLCSTVHVAHAHGGRGAQHGKKRRRPIRPPQPRVAEVCAGSSDPLSAV